MRHVYTRYLNALSQWCLTLCSPAPDVALQWENDGWLCGLSLFGWGKHCGVGDEKGGAPLPRRLASGALRCRGWGA